MSRIFLNVETVPHDAFPGMPCPPQWAYDKTVQPLPEMGHVPRNWTNREKIEAREAELVLEHRKAVDAHSGEWAKRAAKLWESGSLDPLRARIVVGCVAVDDEDPIVLPGENILPWLQMHLGGSYAAYNCGFDRQMLFGRALRGDFGPLARHLRVARWEDPGETWRQLGSRWYQIPHHSLNAMCEAFKVPCNPGFTGADVLRAYIRGDDEAIHAHCLDRVSALRELYWKVCA